MQKKNKIGLRTFAGTFGTGLIIQACTVLQGVLIARMLGPEGRGEYAAVILWPSFFAAIGIFGSNIALARISAKENDRGSLFRTSILISLFTSSIAAIACFFAIPHLLPKNNIDLVNLARIFVIFIPINHLGLNIIAIDQGAGDFKKYNITRLITNPLYVSMVIFLWVIGNSTIKTLSVALLIANLLVVLFRLIWTLKSYSIVGKIYDFRNVFKQSIHFGLAGIAQPIYQQADKALMLWLLGTENLGIYVVALSSSAVIGSVTNSAGAISFTTAAKAETGEGFERIAKIFRLSLSLWIFLGCILALIMPFVLPIVYGKDYQSAINPARLLIVGSAFAGLANLLEQSMRGQGRAFVGLEGRFAGLCVMGLVGILTASSLGVSGVCIAYILGQLTCLLVIVRRTSMHFNTKWFSRNYIPDLLEIKSILFSCKAKLSGNKT